MFKPLATVLPFALLAVPLPAKTLYFATYGSDTNKCTYTAPCQSFAALTPQNVQAADGDTILALDGVDFSAGGTQYGIFSNITIDGGAHGAFMTAIGEQFALSIVVSGTPANVVIRNLTIFVPPAAGTEGISYAIQAGGSISLENISIRMRGGSTVQAIFGQVGGGASSVHINGLTMSGIGDGVFLQSLGPSAAQYTFDNVSSYLTGTAMNLSDVLATIHNSSFSSPGGGTGILTNAGSFVANYFIDTCSFKNLATGINVSAQSLMRISNSSFSALGNGILSATGATVISFRNNVFAGNVVDGAPALTTSLK